MKIKELIEELKKYDPETLAACYCNGEGLTANEKDIELFEVNSVSEIEAEAIRQDEGVGKPLLKVGQSDKSSKYLLIEITSDI